MSFDLFDSPELLDIQREGFYNFLREDIGNLLAKQFPIRVKSGSYSIELCLNDQNVKLITPESSPRDCILNMKTYSCKLYAQVKIICKKRSSINFQKTANPFFALYKPKNKVFKNRLFCTYQCTDERLSRCIPKKKVHSQFCFSKTNFVATSENLLRKTKESTSEAIVYESVPEWVLLGQLPMMTKRGHFIINGSPRVIVHQVVRAPGIYFQKLIKKEEQHLARFYGDIIPLKGVWVRLQMTKKGRIEAKFKKGKKIQVEFLQKCLQVIEDQVSLFDQSFFFNLYAPDKLKHSFQVGASTKRFAKAKPTSLPLTRICFAKQNVTIRNSSNSNLLYEDYSTLLEKKKSRASSKAEHDAFIHTYDKLYRTTQDKELEEWQKKKSNLSFFKGLSPENAFKRKKCSENLFSSFKIPARYDLGLLGREKINDKFGLIRNPSVNRQFLNNTKTNRIFLKKFAAPGGSTFGMHRRFGFNKTWKAPKKQDLRSQNASVTKYISLSTESSLCTESALQVQNKVLVRRRASSNTNKVHQLTAMDLFSATIWLYKLRRGEKCTDDIDHSQNRRVRTSGELFQTQFENGVERLKNLLSTKLQEWKTSFSRSTFSSIFQKGYKTRYSDQFLFKSLRQHSLAYSRIKEILYLDFAPSSCTHLRNAPSTHSKHVFGLTGVCNGKYITKFGSSKRTKFNLVATRENLLLRNKTKTRVSFYSVATIENLLRRSKTKRSKLENTYKISVKEVFSTKPITGALREFFGSNPLSQYMDQTNPLAEITHKRRISSLGVGGVSRESAGMAIRGIHPTHYGRICPIETPEGKNAGLVNSLAFYTKVDMNGFLKTPYYRVVKGQIQPSLGFSFTSAKEESLTGLYIAPSDLQKSSNNILRTKDTLLEAVPVRVTDNQLDVFKKENPYKVQLIGISPIQMISVATSLIPFLEHNDANRALMGSNMQRQAVPLMISERPIVGTGLESIVIVESGHITESQVAGFASQVTANKIIIDRLCSQEKNELKTKFLELKTKFLESTSVHKFFCKSHAYYHNTTFCLGNEVGFASKKPNLGSGNEVGFTLAKRFYSKKQALTNGNKVGFALAKRFAKAKLALHLRHVSSECTFTDRRKGYFFAPAGAETSVKSLSRICFAKRFVKTKPTSLQSKTILREKKDSFLQASANFLTTFSRSNQNTCITEKPLIQQFDWVQKGDIVSDCSASNNGELAVGKNVLVAYIPWEGYNFEDAIVINERLVRSHVYTSLHIERYTFQAQDLKDGNEWFTRHLPGIEDRFVEHLEESGLPKIGSFLKEGSILVGKIRYLNKKPSSPYERLLCDILGEKNFAARNKSLYVPKGVEARVIYHRVINQFDNEPENKVRPPKAAKTVNIFLGEKRVIQVGDKISGRHGNKGVISTILPRQDMPYLPDGTPIDIILNPLGVPSRMNVGQVLECLLGLAADYLNQHFKVTAFDERYGVEASKSIVFLKLYQARLESGQNWLFQVNFPGKTRLVDGRSGLCFDQWITVGKAYILKLIHMVSEKIHARSTGPYALITQQPLRGRSNKGGQRLGEMEVWALEGFGAAYTLQELLTKKSDDFFGRKQIVDSILPNPSSIVDTLQPNLRIHKSRPILGHPEIFKVLLCELQALCLDLGVYIVTPESFQRSFLGVVH
uniref:RNA polymerase beta subunit n=1 Tax=Polulichloris maxima TaxID=2704661 RepID=UPI002410E36B|nr:RNA polymerase beta subunit [Polulichloris maxima]WDY13269.1 RNA polymerase beta subunit [Polulichloris maxima]